MGCCHMNEVFHEPHISMSSEECLNKAPEKPAFLSRVSGNVSGTFTGMANVNVREGLEKASSITNVAGDSIKRLEREATSSYKLVKEDLGDAMAAVDIEKVGDFVNSNLKDPLLEAGQQVGTIVRENLQATLDAIKDIKLKQRVTDIIYPIFRKIFVHSVHGIVEDAFEIQEIIGQGGCSTVRKAIHRASSIERAIKMITKNSLSETQKISISEETDILKSLDHPNIIKVIEIVEDTTKLNIITELCTGGELFERIAMYKTFSENMAANFMYQILSGLIHIHHHKIVHKDIKPENIMFVNKNEDYLKIIDFGIAQYENMPRTGKNYNGSVFYIAPEVTQGQLCCKSDVWSCGVILFIMLGGRPPFIGKNEADTFAKINRGVFNFSGKEWAGVSKEAKNLIQKMLTKDVNKRISAEEAWNEPWVQNRSKENSENTIDVSTLESLANFRTTSKLQQATLSYIASNLTTCQEINELKKAFVILDSNGDGRLSLSELRSGFGNLRLSCAVDIERIIKQCDMDNNGMIDYSEFITATLDWGKHLTQEMLENAFKAYDVDLNGSIGVEEIKGFLGGDNLYNDVWDQMLVDADMNGDGRIDLKEFKNLMLSAFKIN